MSLYLTSSPLRLFGLYYRYSSGPAFLPLRLRAQVISHQHWSAASRSREPKAEGSLSDSTLYVHLVRVAVYHVFTNRTFCLC